MKKVLITGATGFVGNYLTDYLASKKEFEIYGTSLTDFESNDKIQIEKIDLTNFESVVGLIEKIKPDYLYHLAAFTSPAASISNPTPTVLGNIEIQMNVLNAVKNIGLNKTRLLVVSSGEVYGLVGKDDLPIDEDTPMRPLNPYAVSKIAQDFLSMQYSLTYDLDIVRVRPFNHTGPGQTPTFAIPSFSEQIVRIEKGKQDPILKVGNLTAKRDFTDVRDIVKGYVLLLEKGIRGEVYNIGSGKSYQMKDLLDILLAFCNKKITIESDPSKFQPVGYEDFYCDYSKLNLLTEWKPEIPIEKTLQDTLDYWRKIV